MLVDDDVAAGAVEGNGKIGGNAGGKGASKMNSSVYEKSRQFFSKVFFFFYLISQNQFNS